MSDAATTPVTISEPPVPDPPAPDPAGRRTIHVVGAALIRSGQVLAARRAPHVAAAGHWELPGGKIEDGESPEEALRREWHEEMRLDIEVGRYLGRGIDTRPDLVIVLDVYLATCDDGEPALVDHDAIRWLGADALEQVAWGAADRPVLAALSSALSLEPASDVRGAR